jgi:hypothetical protein
MRLKVLISLFILTSLFASIPIRVEGQASTAVPYVAVHVSEYTRTHWFYTSWKYYHIYKYLEESLRSDGTPFLEITDAQIENGQLLTASSSPKYPILISLAAECISSTEAQKIKEYVEAGGFAYVGSSSWTRKEDGSPLSVGGETVTVVADCTWDGSGGPGEDPRYIASKTLDGDPTTYWLMDNNKYDGTTGLPVDKPINITYTFDQVYELKWVEVTQSSFTASNYKTKNYEIYTSIDGTLWNKVAQNTLPNTNGAVQATTFTPTSAGKVRISVTSVWVSQTANTGGLGEFKAVTTGTNLVSISPSSVVADSSWDPAFGPGEDPRYVASKTLDGDPNTYWLMDNDLYSTSTGLPVDKPINITYTFEGSLEMDRIQLTQSGWTANNYKTKDYEVWISVDGTSWTTAAQDTLPNTDGATQTKMLTPVNAKKVRITSKSVWVPQEAHSGGLAEFKALTTAGQTLPAPPTYTSWLAEEIGLDCLPTYHEAARTELGGKDWWNSWSNVGPADRGVLVENTVDHRLVNHIPKGLRLLWILPERYDDCPAGSNTVTHLAWATSSTTATVLATFEWTGPVTSTSEGYRDIPLIAYKNLGSGTFIYHSDLAPLAGYGGTSVDAFTYTFIRKSIEWAFEANNVPLIRLAPWSYPNKAAFIIRTDCDGGIAPILDYVAIDQARGVSGDYYIETNTVSDPSLLTTAQSRGAIIGSHSSYHTGPDSEGYTAAFNNIKGSLDALETWLGSRPKVWVSPNFRAVREQSLQIIEQCGLLTAGEQGTGVHPHFAVSMETQGEYYNVLELPTVEYFSTDAPELDILQCFSFYTSCSDPNGTMRKAIDFAYDLEGLINIYSHFRSGNLQRRAYYIEYTKTKPDVWLTNAEEVYNWWIKRNLTSITPTYEHSSPDRISVTVSGPSDPGPFALDVTVPWSYETVVVKVNGVVTSNYENTGGKLRVSVGSPSQVEILLPHAEIESYHSSGIQDDEFVPGESICVIGSSFNPGNYPTYVVKDASWNEPMAIPTRIAESSVTADSSGNVALTTVWSSATPGKYDIIVDVNGNSQYDAGVDVLLDNKVQITAGFFVIPEYALGTILALAVCFAGVAVYRRSKRTRLKP